MLGASRLGWNGQAEGAIHSPRRCTLGLQEPGRKHETKLSRGAPLRPPDAPSTGKDRLRLTGLIVADPLVFRWQVNLPAQPVEPPALPLGNARGGGPCPCHPPFTVGRLCEPYRLEWFIGVPESVGGVPALPDLPTATLVQPFRLYQRTALRLLIL